MNWYSIHIDRRGAGLTADQAGDLLDALDKHHAGGVSHGADGFSTTISVEATNPVEAASIAHAILLATLADLGVSGGRTEVLEVITDDELHRRLDQPAFPELVGVAEIADMLGVTRQRAGQVRNTAHGFPAPVAELRSGPVWRRGDLDTFVDSWPRRSGRPAKTA